MNDALMSRNLLWANLSEERIARALRQHKRLQKSYEAMQKEQERLFALHGSDKPMLMPGSYTYLEAVFQDHLYFFVVSTRQALKATWVLEKRGESMPTFRQGEKLRAWRDFEEHWDAEGRGAPDTARQTWQRNSGDEEPGLTYGGRGYSLQNVSGISLRKLRKDMRKARAAALAISDREWQYCYITAAEAAEILGMTEEEFEAMPSKPMNMDCSDFGPEPRGTRYWREWVEARRDGRDIPPGWDDYL